LDRDYAVGIDVSKDWIDVERADGAGGIEARRFDNDAAGHRALCRWLRQREGSARVVVEATGSYHRGVVGALYATKGIEVMVANPMAVKNYRRALLQRASTDRSSASALRQFAETMKFVPWKPPAKLRLNLRALARRAATLTDSLTEEKNRLHASRVAKEPRAVLDSLRGMITALSKMRERVRAEAVRIIEGDEELSKAFTALLSIKSVGQVSAIAILGEVSCLAQGLTARQWVAYAGLDPRPVESGSSVRLARHISKIGNVHLRRALFMPALVGVRSNPVIKAYAGHLEAKGKAKLVVLVAVMRKLLHAMYGMLRSGSRFDPEKFYRIPNTSSSQITSVTTHRCPEPPAEATVRPSPT
jgi:transposase